MKLNQSGGFISGDKKSSMRVARDVHYAILRSVFALFLRVRIWPILRSFALCENFANRCTSLRVAKIFSNACARKVYLLTIQILELQIFNFRIFLSKLTSILSHVVNLTAPRPKNTPTICCLGKQLQTKMNIMFRCFFLAPYFFFCRRFVGLNWS